MGMDFEAEIRDLKRRVTELEGSFGFLTNQVKAVHTDLLQFQQATVAFQKAALAEFQSLRGEFQLLRRDLPDLIAGGVSEALRKQ